MLIPCAEQAYLDAVVARLRGVFGDALVGAYPTGSAPLGGYQPGRSDLDVIAVVTQPSRADLDAAAGELAHDVLPCPATGLELVVYNRDTLAHLTIEGGFALNLNTGRELPPVVETEPGDGLQFWYAIDRDMVHQHGQVLTGPAFVTLTPRQPYSALLPVVVASVDAHLVNLVGHGDNAVLNACRSLRFHAERVWSAKPVAAAWARDYAPDHESVINAALDSHGRGRAAGRVIDMVSARAFLIFVRQRLTNRR